jgi:hypothetical protein
MGWEIAHRRLRDSVYGKEAFCLGNGIVETGGHYRTGCTAASSFVKETKFSKLVSDVVSGNMEEPVSLPFPLCAIVTVAFPYRFCLKFLMSI